MVIFNNNYFKDMDAFETQHEQEEDPINFTTRDIGTTTTPMGNTIESLKARIRQGNGRIEFAFLGQGKGTQNAPTPSSFGKAERKDIRDLLKINKMKGSTHAAVHTDSLAGFSQDRGFTEENRARTLKEIKKAIDFASEATTGGAIVFHLGEWFRNMADIDPNSEFQFRAHSEEETKSPLLLVDKRDGSMIGGITRDQELQRLVYETAGDRGLSGTRDDNGNILKKDDWVDVDGNLIPRDAPVEKLFDRVPKYDSTRTRFETEKVDWNKLVDLTKEHNQTNGGKKLKPEEMYARIMLENEVLKAKGQSLYHAKEYEDAKESLDELKKIKDSYEKLREELPDDKKWQAESLLRNNLGLKQRGLDEKSPIDELNRQIRKAKDMMRYIHESSGSADVMADQTKERMDNITTAEEVGLNRTAKTIAEAALYAMDKYNKNKDKYGLEDPLYVAPENFDPRSYGSHPDEYRKAIDASRKAMIERLEKRNIPREQAQKLAKTHIKGTLDIGHLNLYRNYFQPKDENETPEQTQKRFEKWMLKESEKLMKEGYVGHIHLSDNFGYDDEHLSPGEGNIPMRQFIKLAEKYKLNDVIVENGSYNDITAIPDTLNLVGSPIYGLNRKRFDRVRNNHHGQNVPATFITGGYAPSNDWRFWSDVPLE